jgi:hypothetical protein
MRERWRARLERVCRVGFIAALLLLLGALGPIRGRLELLAVLAVPFGIAWLFFGDRMFGADGGKLYFLTMIVLAIACLVIAPIYMLVMLKRRKSEN